MATLRRSSSRGRSREVRGRSGLGRLSRGPDVTRGGVSPFTNAQRSDRFRTNVRNLGELNRAMVGLDLQEEASERDDKRLAMEGQIQKALQADRVFRRNLDLAKAKSSVKTAREAGRRSEEQFEASQKGMDERLDRQLSSQEKRAQDTIAAGDRRQASTLASQLAGQKGRLRSSAIKAQAGVAKEQMKNRAKYRESLRELEGEEGKLRSELEQKFREAFEIDADEPIPTSGEEGGRFADFIRTNPQYQSIQKRRADLQRQFGDRPAAPQGRGEQGPKPDPTNPLAGRGRRGANLRTDGSGGEPANLSQAEDALIEELEAEFRDSLAPQDDLPSLTANIQGDLADYIRNHPRYKELRRRRAALRGEESEAPSGEQERLREESRNIRSAERERVRSGSPRAPQTRRRTQREENPSRALRPAPPPLPF